VDACKRGLPDVSRVGSRAVWTLVRRWREQRAADLGALAAARTMHDACDALFEPPMLDDGRANPRHLEVGAYERMGREAALGVARANGAAANCKTHGLWAPFG
jgi:hypothetical protein